MKIGRRAALAGLPVLLTATLLTAAPAGAQSSLRVTSVSMDEQREGWKLTAACPHVSGIVDEAAQSRLNVRFRELALIVREETRYAAALSKGAEGTFGYVVARNENGVMSVVLRGQVTPAGSRGSVHVNAVTIDTVTGKTLTLADVFAPGADIGALVGEQVRARQKTRGLSVGGSFDPGPDFYLTPDTLVVFQRTASQNQIGVVEFAIPLAALRANLRPAFNPAA